MLQLELSLQNHGFADSAQAVTFSSNAATATASKWAHYLTSSSSGTDILTLPNGSTGQIKYFVLVSDGGSSPWRTSTITY